MKIIRNEINMYKKLSSTIKTHPNLITIHDIFLTKNYIYIVMELCEKNCSLKEYIFQLQRKRVLLSESEIILIIDNIFKGL